MKSCTCPCHSSTNEFCNDCCPCELWRKQYNEPLAMALEKIEDKCRRMVISKNYYPLIAEIVDICQEALAMSENA